MVFVLATNNQKKRDEMERILRPLGISVVTAQQAGISMEGVEETGSTFEENADIKAVAACRLADLPAVADDSGLVVDALDGAPGVYSPRKALGAFYFGGVLRVPGWPQGDGKRFLRGKHRLFTAGRRGIWI